VIEQKKSLGVVLEHRSLFQVWLSIEVSWSCPWALRSLFLCDWATCNQTLHFSGTLLGSERGTGLLPVCGRNLYNCLCSFFLCSLTTYPLQRLWTHSDSEPENSFSERKEEKFLKTQFNPPFLWFFSPSTFRLKEHLQWYLHLPLFKGTSGARTQVLSDSRLVSLPLDQAFGVYLLIILFKM